MYDYMTFQEWLENICPVSWLGEGHDVLYSEYQADAKKANNDE